MHCYSVEEKNHFPWFVTWLASRLVNMHHLMCLKIGLMAISTLRTKIATQIVNSTSHKYPKIMFIWLSKLSITANRQFSQISLTSFTLHYYCPIMTTGHKELDDTMLFFLCCVLFIALSKHPLEVWSCGISVNQSIIITGISPRAKNVVTYILEITVSKHWLFSGDYLPATLFLEKKGPKVSC